MLELVEKVLEQHSVGQIEIFSSDLFTVLVLLYKFIEIVISFINSSNLKVNSASLGLTIFIFRIFIIYLKEALHEIDSFISDILFEILVVIYFIEIKF